MSRLIGTGEAKEKVQWTAGSLLQGLGLLHASRAGKLTRCCLLFDGVSAQTRAFQGGVASFACCFSL